MTDYNNREPAPVPLLAKSTHSAAAAAAATSTATPPITPPTLPLNMATMDPTARDLAIATETAAQHTRTAASSSPTTPTTTATTNTQAAAAAAAACNISTSTPTAQATATTHMSAGAALQDHYSLRWNNHQNHILRAFDALLQTKTLVDVTLVCAETSIRAHKMVLSACSPFFQRVFAETPCKHPVIVLKDFRGWVVQAIVDFMYRGEISVPQERLQTLIQAGESLQVRGLVESSVPEHTPTPAASPDDFGMIDTSLMSSELERCSSFDEDTPSMVTSGAKLIMPSRLFGSVPPTATSLSMRRAHERKRERERDTREGRDYGDALESDQELAANADLCTSPMPRRKQARPRRRSGELPHDFELGADVGVPPHTMPEALALQRDIDDAHAKQLAALQTVIKRELIDDAIEAQEQMQSQTQSAGDASGNEEDAKSPQAHHMALDEDEDMVGARDSGNDSQELNDTPATDSLIPTKHHESDNHTEAHNKHSVDNLALHDIDSDSDNDNDMEHMQPNDDDADGDEPEDLHNHAADVEEEDIEELINATNALRRKAVQSPCHSDGPEDLCTTKKDTHNDTSGHHSGGVSSDNECSPANNNNNSSKLKDNNNRIVLSLKDIRHLNKPNSTSTPNSACNLNLSSSNNSSGGGSGNSGMHPFAAASLRDLRLDRASSMPDSPCNMEALEAQMHAAAAAAVAAAAGGADNPFQHMEHQMDLSLAAAAAAAAAVSQQQHHHHHHHTQQHQQQQQQQHQHSRDREREHAAALQREQRELQQQHNAFANSLLGPMGMPPFGPGSGPGGPAPHERLEESMNRLSKEFGKEFGKEFAPSSPMSLPSHFNPPDGPPHPPSPLPFPGMSSALTLTPPHMFGLDSPLGLFPPGIDPGKLYNPLMEMSDPRDMPGGPPPFLKKKMPRPKGQHSAPRGGPPRSWTNSELTEALQHVWNKKMTTSQASRIFGIPYNSLLMYVRGKYGKSLKLEQLRKDCISGPPLEMLQMGISSGSGSGGGGGGSGSSKSEKHKERKERDKDKNANNSMPVTGPDGLPLDLDLGIPMPPGGPRSASSEPDLLGGPNAALFNPFNPQGFYPDFPGGFPGLPLSMLNLLPPSERHQHAAAAAAAMHHMSGSGLGLDEDCKSDRSKQSSSLDDDAFAGPLALSSRDEHRRSNEMLAAVNNGNGLSQPNGGAAQD